MFLSHRDSIAGAPPESAGRPVGRNGLSDKSPLVPPSSRKKWCLAPHGNPFMENVSTPLVDSLVFHLLTGG